MDGGRGKEGFGGIGRPKFGRSTLSVLGGIDAKSAKIDVLSDEAVDTVSQYRRQI